MRKLLFVFIALFLFTQFLSFQSLLAQNSFTYTYHSDFTQYPPGSDGSPEWLTYSTGWEIQKDALWATDIQPNSAVLSPAPYGKLHSNEVIINLQ